MSSSHCSVQIVISSIKPVHTAVAGSTSGITGANTGCCGVYVDVIYNQQQKVCTQLAKLNCDEIPDLVIYNFRYLYRVAIAYHT